MLTVRDIQEALARSGRVQQDYHKVVVYNNNGAKKHNPNALLKATELKTNAKKAKVKSVQVWTVQSVQLVKLAGNRRFAEKAISLLEAVKYVGRETLTEALEQRLTFLPVYAKGIAVQLDWAYTLEHPKTA